MPKDATSPRDTVDRHAEALAMLREIDARLEVEKIRAQKTASEVAAEHLGTYGAGYLVLMVLAFFGACLFLPESTISVVAGLTTLIVTSMIQLLKQVVGESVPAKAPDNGDPSGGKP